MKPLILVMAMMLAACGANPHEVRVPMTLDATVLEVNPDFKAARERLPEEERSLLDDYLQLRQLGRALGAPAPTEAPTIGEVLVFQREIREQHRIREEKRAAEEAEARRAAEEARQRAEAKMAELQGAVQATVVGKSLKQDGYRKLIMLTVVLQNLTDKPISAVKGMLVLQDSFGEQIKGVNLQHEKGLKPGEQKVVQYYINYNPYFPEDVRLVGMGMDNLRSKWEPEGILFSDGTMLTSRD